MQDNVLVEHGDLARFTSQVFEQSGIPEVQARDAASVLVWANLCGVDTHGVRNLKFYTGMIEKGTVQKVRNDLAIRFALDQPF